MKKITFSFAEQKTMVPRKRRSKGNGCSRYIWHGGCCDKAVQILKI